MEQINQFTDKFFRRTGFKVHEFTSNYSEHKDKKFLKDLYYRFNNESDLSLLIKNIKNSLELYGSLENLFKQNYSDTHENILSYLQSFKTFRLVSRNSCDLKFAVELTKKLKKFDSSDPVKYDFALCHLGIEGEI
ncbi:MAG: DUF2400 family protein [Ignavibacteria bacterium]|nr:DUF2400 family protein [Ignavibacteria bacterium]